MDSALEELVRRRAGSRCEYCLLPQTLVSTPFQLDHIIARFHGGASEAENLAYACFHCNNFKGTNVAGVDPQNGEVVRLFHPRRDDFKEHFVWQSEQLSGRTPVGRATIVTLRLNHPHRLAVRRSFLREGIAVE
jgi:hypothetical protein